MIGEVRDVARDDGVEEVVVERDDVEAEDGAVWIGLLNRNGVERDRRSPSTSTWPSQCISGLAVGVALSGLLIFVCKSDAKADATIPS